VDLKSGYRAGHPQSLIVLALLKSK
jgi:hypothetical protein